MGKKKTKHHDINADVNKKTDDSTTTGVTSSVISLDEPTELSLDDYNALVDQIRAGSDNVDFVWTLENCQSELLEAARYNEIDLVRAILKVHGSTIVAYQHATSRNTALHMAAANGHADMVRLLLSVAASSTASSSSSSSCSTSSLIMMTNASGNTPLHWAASNGQEAIVPILLQAASASASANNNGDVEVDVLQRNAFGRSALTEGFASDKTEVIQALLEHESATEERLLETSTTTLGAAKVSRNDKNDECDDDDDDDDDDVEDSVTHTLILGRSCSAGRKQQPQDDNVGSEEEDENKNKMLVVRVRERAMAHTGKDSILAQGADRPQDDTTGLGIWASAIVAAQWMAHVVSQRAIHLLTTASDDDAAADASTDYNNDDDTTTLSSTLSFLELGAGCGLPSLVLAKLCPKAIIYATDFNTATLENLQYNIQLNSSSLADEDDDGDDSDGPKEKQSSGGTAIINNKITALLMNWQDPSTWPTHKIDHIVGSDLIYQSNMVPLLVSTLCGLLRRSPRARFWYVAPNQEQDQQEQDDRVGRRQGHTALVEALTEHAFDAVSVQPAPAAYSQNPLKSQDDEECFLHFHELQSTRYVLYEFQWKKDKLLAATTTTTTTTME